MQDSSPAPLKYWPVFDAKRYIRIGETPDVWAVTFKIASTTLRRGLPDADNYAELKKGDHVRMLCRDPRDKVVSAWRWFALHRNSYIPHVLDVSRRDHDYILSRNSRFKDWVQTALRYWDPHWAPQTSIHPRWREFELLDLAEWGKGEAHEKKTRDDNSWEQYYDDATLALVNEVYKEDLEMWKEIKDGTDTRARRVL